MWGHCDGGTVLLYKQAMFFELKAVAITTGAAHFGKVCVAVAIVFGTYGEMIERIDAVAVAQSFRARTCGHTHTHTHTYT